VKSYPRGVTTNSDGGIESYEVYYPVFEAMEQEDLVLNLHGEIPSDGDAVRIQTGGCSCTHADICIEYLRFKRGTCLLTSSTEDS
jgi:hypothetical protein